MFTTFKQDIKKYVSYSNKNWVVLLLTQQGLWAIFVYRFSHSIYKSKVPVIIKKILLIPCVLSQKWIEIIAGISIPYSAVIGKGFYIGHFGGIIINANTVIGDDCNISQGVTLGVSGKGNERGVPVIGNRVYIGANSVVAGKIFIGDGVVIGANTFVNKSVAANTTVLGVPAIKINNHNSDYYI